MIHLMGSAYFFSQYPEFTPHDIDKIEIIETDDFQHKRQLTGRGKCFFQLKKKDHFQEYLDWDIHCGLGMSVGKWLVPEFCEEVGFRVADLPKLLPLIEVLDDRHQYEKVIYDAYVENQSFTLSDEQRLAAYNSYRTSRGLSTVD